MWIKNKQVENHRKDSYEVLRNYVFKEKYEYTCKKWTYFNDVTMF